jgi:hypothetical protein
MVLSTKIITRSNGKETMKLQQMVEDYVLLLRTKISNGEITATTGQTMILPIKLLCEMNDIYSAISVDADTLPNIGQSCAEAALTKVMNAVKVLLEDVWEAGGVGLEMEVKMV